MTKVKYVPVKTVLERIEKLGKVDIVWKSLTTSQQLKLLTLKEGIAVGDVEVAILFTKLGIEMDKVLY